MDKSTCSVSGCSDTPYARGKCLRHYGKARYAESKQRKSKCSWPGCDRPDWRRRFCTAHIYRARKLQNFENPWEEWTPSRPYHGQHDLCRWPECDKTEIKGQGLCALHYRRATDVGDYERPWSKWKTGGECIICGARVDSRIRDRRFCSSNCNLKAWKKANRDRYLAMERERVRRRRAAIKATEVQRFTDAAVRETYGDICYLCGRPIDFELQWPHPESPSLDHVVPLSRGGTHTLDNCAMTHWVCNNKKNAQPVDVRPVRLDSAT